MLFRSLFFFHANYFKDLPLLDYMGLQISCCGHSFIPSNRILRSVNLRLSSLFELLIQFMIHSSFMVGVTNTSKILPRETHWGKLDGCGMYRLVNDRECSGDGFNRVQDPQGVPGS